MNTIQLSPSLYERASEQILASLEVGFIPWRRPWSPFGPPRDVITKYLFSGPDLWLLHSMRHRSNLFISEAQLRDVGGNLIDGAVGCPLLLEYEQYPQHEIVYNVEQCVGIPEEMLRQNPVEIYPAVNACAALMVTMQDKPALKYEGSVTCYNLAEDTVYMANASNYVSLEEYYRALFHQHAHATGHSKRLGRPSVHEMAEFGYDPCTQEELVAELATGCICALFQIAAYLPRCTWRYINQWKDKLRSDKEIFVRASIEAQEAVEYLIKDNLIAASLLL